MSKHNNKKNYTNYSQCFNSTNEPTTEEVKVADQLESENKEPAAVVDEPVVSQEPETIPTPAEPTMGVVSNCAKLRVRENASVDSDELCVLKNGDEVQIDESASTEDFYKVYTEEGVEGYCVKKFIESIVKIKA